ncbi:MAG: 50S ribosomal protein L18 [Gammaproteobacteria bacterium]
MDKKATRQRRGRKTRAHIKSLGAARLCIHRTPRHIYAQVIAADNSAVLAAASTVEKDFRAGGVYGGNVAAATEVGKLVAQRALAAGVSQVAFDRSGFKYHGRVQALADAARETGLKF